MQNKVIRNIFIIVISLILISGTFSGGLWLGYFLNTNQDQTSAYTNYENNFSSTNPTLGVESQQTTSSSQNIDQLFTPFWQTWDLVHDQYVDQPVDDITLMQGAIRGMLDSLGDEHTGYMDPDQYQQANAPLNGSYTGIGAYVDSESDFLTIVSPIPGTPAEAAGLRPGDEIIAVDGEDMTGIDASLVLRRVLGPAGEQVTLTIQREGLNEPFDVTIIRAVIVLPSVTSRMETGNIAYIQLSAFGATTDNDLQDAIETLLAQNPDGLILDLRNNGGGYLTSAVSVVSQFIGEGIVLNEVSGDGTSQTYDAMSGGLALDIPLVVLVNSGSASASEIVAGAIQDYSRGILIGETTYGKGSVQIWTPLENNQGAVRITVARWLTPNGRQINHIGLTPDIEIPFTQEDYDAGHDPQLERALQYFQTGQ